MTLRHQVLDASRQLVLAAFICIAPAWFVYALQSTPDPDFLLNNSMELQQRLTVVLAALGSLIVAGTIYGLWVGRMLAVGRFPTLRDACAYLNRSLLILLALPALPLLTVHNFETEHTWLTFTIIAITAVLALVWSYHLSGSDWSALRRAAQRLPRQLPWLVTGACSMFYVFAISRLAILQHHALHVHSKDLGNYVSVVWNALGGEFLRSTFMRGDVHYSSHFDPILMLLAPIYAIEPRAETLLIFQSIWLALGAVPVFLAARRVLESSWWGTWASVIYLLQPALHGANLYQFHSITLVIPIFCWLIYCADTRRWLPYGFLLAAMLLTREDMSLAAIFVGIYCISARRSARAGGLTIFVSVIYLLIVKLFVMPDAGLFMADSKESYSFAYYYDDLVSDPALGVRGILLSLLSNPAFVLQHILTTAKVSYLLKMLMPTLFLSLLAGRMRWLLVYGLAATVLATHEAMFTVTFHYTATILPGLLLALPVGVKVLADRSADQFSLSRWRTRCALGVAIAVATLGISAKYGALVPNDAFRVGFFRLERELSVEDAARYRWLLGVVEEIPADASVSATKALGAHIANRDWAFFFPELRDADYLLIDRRRVSKDRSLAGKMREIEGQYELIEAFGELELYRRSSRRSFSSIRCKYWINPLKAYCT